MRSKAPWLFLALAVVLTACGKDQVSEYEVPKEKVPAARPGGPQETPATVELPEWKVPEGWKELPGEGMRYATLVVEAGEPPLEVRVTPLGMAARDPLANVNRWREQIGLGPIESQDLAQVHRTENVGGRSVDLVDMTGPAGDGQPATRILAAIVPGSDTVWFFMLMAPADRVGKHTKEFESFVRSIRLKTAPAAAAMPPDHPPMEGMPPDHPPMGDMPPDHPPVASAPDAQQPSSGSELVWSLPAGWKQEASSSAFRLGTFKFADGGEAAEVAITKFAGGAGGVLENINRWRGQIGLAPVGKLEDQPVTNVRVAGRSADRLDIVANTGDAAQRQRMIVVTLLRDDVAYFIKMTGASALLDKHLGDFDAFLASIQFAGVRS